MKQTQVLVGQRIKELRREAGFSQEAFADQAQINRSHIGEIERGEMNLTLSVLMKVSQALGVKVSKLVQGIV